MKLFVALVEVAPTAPDALSGAEGAAVRVYVLARDAGSALDVLKRALPARALRLTDIEWIVDDAEADWENPQTPGGLRLREKARRDGLAFDLFHCW